MKSSLNIKLSSAGKILDNFTKKWNTLSSMTANYLKFAPISLHMTKKEIKYLTFDRAMEIKRKVRKRNSSSALVFVTRGTD